MRQTLLPKKDFCLANHSRQIVPYNDDTILKIKNQIFAGYILKQKEFQRYEKIISRFSRAFDGS
jgi:hypothetical protein